MWGHRFDPTPTNEHGRNEHFPCEVLCRREGTDKLDPEKRARLNCALPGFDLSLWTGERAGNVSMGAGPDYSRSGESRDIDRDWRSPTEDPEEIGCPGSWVRSPFVQSVLRYFRPRDQQGNRTANPALDRCDDPLVHEAIMVLERHDDAGYGEFLHQITLRRSAQ